MAQWDQREREVGAGVSYQGTDKCRASLCLWAASQRVLLSPAHFSINSLSSSSPHLSFLYFLALPIPRAVPATL